MSPESHVYPVKVLTKILGEPTYQSMFQLHSELIMNARSVASTRGGGASGHLALVITAAKYLAETGVAFNPPVHPGDPPVHPAAGITGPQITAADRLYDYRLKEFLTFRAVETALKSQLWDAVDERHYRTLRQGVNGYSNVPVLTIINHLLDKKGKIPTKAKLANTNRLKEDFDPSEPISNLWNRIDDIQDRKSVV